jgi:hypothetical protein
MFQLSFDKRSESEMSSEEQEYHKQRVEYLVSRVQLEEIEEEYHIREPTLTNSEKQKLQLEIENWRKEVESAHQRLCTAGDRLLQNSKKEKDA